MTAVCGGRVRVRKIDMRGGELTVRSTPDGQGRKEGGEDREVNGQGTRERVGCPLFIHTRTARRWPRHGRPIWGGRSEKDAAFHLSESGHALEDSL